MRKENKSIQVILIYFQLGTNKIYINKNEIGWTEVAWLDRSDRVARKKTVTFVGSVSFK